MMIWCELQQLMHTKCHKAGILALAPTPCSKCMVRGWKVRNCYEQFLNEQTDSLQIGKKGI